MKARPSDSIVPGSIAPFAHRNLRPIHPPGGCQFFRLPRAACSQRTEFPLDNAVEEPKRVSGLSNFMSDRATSFLVEPTSEMSLQTTKTVVRTKSYRRGKSNPLHVQRTNCKGCTLEQQDCSAMSVKKKPKLGICELTMGTFISFYRVAYRKIWTRSFMITGVSMDSTVRGYKKK